MSKSKWICYGLFLFSLSANAHVRRVEVSQDQIVTVRTAIGIATIIQVPDRPNSVVVGDLESFKVEYLDQAITIKPLQHGARSNLYVYTDWNRYNVQLITGSEVAADYVVYLENPKQKVSKSVSIKWMLRKQFLKNEQTVLETARLGRTRSGILFVEFEVRSPTAERFSPESIWLTQDGEMLPIQNLVLSSLTIAPNRPLKGLIQIKQADLNREKPFRVELRRNKQSFLTLPKVDSWK